MNLESGFPISHNKNRDSWSSVTLGMPISNENGIGDSWSGMAVPRENGTGDSRSGMYVPQENGIGDSLTMMTTRRPIPMGNGVLGSGDSWNATPKRAIVQRNGIGTPMEPRSNVEKQENENWEDLIGMYTNLLQEETLDLNRIVEDLNPTPPTKMNLNSRLSSNQASTSLSCTSSMLENQQTQAFTSNNLINGEHNTKEDGFPVTYRSCYNPNSPPRSEPNADFPFVPITPDNQIKHTNNQRVPKNVNFPVLDTSTPAKNGHENQTVSLEDAESLYNELLQTIGDSPSSAISTTQKEHIAERDEHAIDLNKTPEQKMSARRKKHRPRVIKEGKPKRTPKPKNLKNETRIKRKYVRKTGVNVNTPEKQHENGVAKRKYVRKKGIDNVESQQKNSVDDVVETQANSCKKRLKFDLECVAQDEDNNINVDSQDIEQERRIKSAMKIVQQNQNTVATTQAGNQHMSGQALNMLARNLTMRNSVPVQSFGLDERRGIKRPIYRNVNAMESIRLYQKMLLGVENGTDNRDNMSGILLENHKKMKMQMHGVYGNGSAMELLNSYQFRTPVGVMHKHQVSSGMQPRAIRWTPGREISSVRGMLGWNLPPPTPPKAACGSAVTSYPATLLEKQSGKMNLYNGMLNGADQMLQQHRNNYQQSLPIAKGQMRKEKVAVLVDDITTKLEGLCICDKNENERNALVLYKGSEAMISFEPIKKRIPRPKVDLDPETDRLWKLLMGKEGSESAETMDKDKEKWWENERRVFRGRADSFIARMHLVQGDRRFSRWKGSVVDSVIGVFLTQNVSDHLSSSAFMSLAAKFPLKSTTKETCFQDRTHVLVEEPIEVIEPNNIIKKQSGNKEDVILSQDSFDSSTIQTVDEIRSSSGSNSEAEDQTNGFAPVADKVSVFKESFGQEYWNTLVDEQATIAHHLPKNKDFSMQIPRINETNNNLNESFASFNSGMTENGTGKQGITISFEANSKEHKYVPQEAPSRGGTKVLKERENEAENLKNRTIDWDGLRKQVFLSGEKRERSKDATDSLDYEAVRRAHVDEISDAIKERGMNNLLADRIKDFLNRLVRDHGSIDLEWLRDAPPDKAKDYLLSFRGLGLKSVECVRLLTLHHLAFPVDTNVGRIAVRLGWVPLQPLPESLQLHLLEMYPVLESIQKYLWPRLCKLDQLTLYELHYQMITFGKVFCTKSKPNCNACPMRAECRHFASAFASARQALPGPEEKRIVTSDAPIATDPTPPVVNRPMALPQAENNYNTSAGTFGQSCEPIIEEPTSPEPEIAELSMSDIEDQYYEDSDEIPSIKLNMEEFTKNLQNIIEDGTELQDNMSKALVALNPNAGSIPTPKLKNVSRLRTEHHVYELPDSHQLLEGLDKREPDDPSPYLLAIWTPGETANSIQPPERGCPTQESGNLCDQATCFSCNCIKEANSQVVRGTILIPCRTAMRGSFPLNGTYFQVNEMFADHASSLNPIDVPRAWIWNLPRRTVYFGTSVSTIFKGLTTEGIQYCFWRGFVCVRGFDQKTRAPRPLMARLHFPASKLKTKNEGK